MNDGRRRVALVVGNAGYAGAPGRLAASNDAARVAAALRRIGFSGIDRDGNPTAWPQPVVDLTRSEFLRLLSAFANLSAGAEQALIYYSGHCIRTGRDSYVVPVDATLDHPGAAEFEAIPVSSLLRAAGEAEGLRLAILDASLLQGLASAPGPLETMSPPENMLVAVSPDRPEAKGIGDAGTSPFTDAMLERLEIPGLDVSGLFAGLGMRPVLHGALKRTEFLVGSEDSKAASPGDEQRRNLDNGRIMTVWYGTNRRPDPDGRYSGDRDNKTHYGTCDVFVPKGHKIGSLGSSFLRRLLTWTDDRLKLQSTQPLEKDAFWSALQNVFVDLGDPGTAIVFVHGYNVSFEGAALRAAQIGFDLQAQQAMAFFSWPSKGTIEGYPADEASIEASEMAIEDFLIDFAEKSGAARVNLIAHSMGNRGVLRAISRIASRAQASTGKRFKQIILAAPDVDADVFKRLATAYAAVAERTSLYVSEKDRAVEASHWLHQFPRAGFAPPTLVVDGIDTVHVTGVDLTMLGHGYVGESRSVLEDMFQLIVHGHAPDMRFGLRAATTNTGQGYWTIKA